MVTISNKVNTMCIIFAASLSVVDWTEPTCNSLAQLNLRGSSDNNAAAQTAATTQESHQSHVGPSNDKGKGTSDGIGLKQDVPFLTQNDLGNNQSVEPEQSQQSQQSQFKYSADPYRQETDVHWSVNPLFKDKPTSVDNNSQQSQSVEPTPTEQSQLIKELLLLKDYATIVDDAELNNHVKVYGISALKQLLADALYGKFRADAYNDLKSDLEIEEQVLEHDDDFRDWLREKVPNKYIQELVHTLHMTLGEVTIPLGSSEGTYGIREHKDQSGNTVQGWFQIGQLKKPVESQILSTIARKGPSGKQCFKMLPVQFSSPWYLCAKPKSTLLQAIETGKASQWIWAKMNSSDALNPNKKMVVNWYIQNQYWSAWNKYPAYLKKNFLEAFPNKDIPMEFQNIHSKLSVKLKQQLMENQKMEGTYSS